MYRILNIPLILGKDAKERKLGGGGMPDGP